MTLRAIFENALELANPDARRSYLETVCAGDPDVLAKVQALLVQQENLDNYLEPKIASDPSLTPISLTHPKLFANGSDSSDQHDHAQEYLEVLQPTSRADSQGRLSHYEILGLLGQGGFATVLKAFDEKLHRVVAVKLMSPQLATTSAPRKRFVREARAVAAINHENIVRVFSVEELPLPFLAMEFVDGITLQDRINQQGPLDLPQILAIGRQVARGLAAAHEKGLIHRDIKPSNILIEHGDEHRVKITDFGIARVIDDASMTQSGTITGTPMYMAPEQANGSSLDCRADLFSLGSVLYTMAAGHPPFRAGNTLAILRRVAEDTPRPLPEIIPELPGWLVAIISKLHAKNAEDRFQTAREVADLLDRCQAEVEASTNHSIKSVELLRLIRNSTKLPSARPVPGNRNWSSSSFPAIPRPVRRRWKAVAALCVPLMAGLLFLAWKNWNQTGGVVARPVSTVSTVPTQERAPEPTEWKGWPAGIPAPAVAPFDAATARNHQEAWARYLKVPVEYTNSLGIKFVLIPPGEFLMGNTVKEVEAALSLADSDTINRTMIQAGAPQHRVILTWPIYFGIHEVTRQQYRRVMERFSSSNGLEATDEAKGNGKEDGKLPQDAVNVYDAIDFCLKLSQMEQRAPLYARRQSGVDTLEGSGYRLPTEAEWEYAYRAGTTTRTWMGDLDSDLADAGWYGENSGGQLHEVGLLRPNGFGLYDVHGNALEWTQDALDPESYSRHLSLPAVNPLGAPIADFQQMTRGSYCLTSAKDIWAARRSWLNAEDRYASLGFRVALTLPIPPALRNLPGAASRPDGSGGPKE